MSACVHVIGLLKSVHKKWMDANKFRDDKDKESSGEEKEEEDSEEDEEDEEPSDAEAETC